MASIEVARHAGACFGVERALELADRVLDGAADGPRGVHTIGPLIHNPSVVASLEARGADVVGEADLAGLPAGDVVVLRTHGVVPQVVEAAQAASLQVADATCPFVKKVHRAAERLSAEGYRVVVVGEAGHPEVEGILGHAPEAVVVGSPEDLDRLDLGPRVGVVVQTTTNKQVLDRIVQRIRDTADDVRLIDTICSATSERQGAARELASRADVMVVIGGRNSANTTHLAEICAALAPTHHIEGADELDGAWFQGASLIGVTAGASTPASQIQQVVRRVEALSGAAPCAPFSGADAGPQASDAGGTRP